MTGLIELAAELQQFLEDRGFEFCFIGGLAVQYWGEPRFTRDVDLTLLTGFGGEEVYVDALLGRYDARVEDARQFALRNRVILLRSSRGIGIDISLGALPFEENAVRRAGLCEVVPGVSLRLSSAEDLIVMKAFADRDQDWLDIKRIVEKQPVSSLDWAYIETELRVLADLKDEPEILQKLLKLSPRQTR